MPDGTELPVWFRVAIIGMVAATMVIHIMIDAFRPDYEGLSTTLMLGGLVGTGLGLNEYLRRGKS